MRIALVDPLAYTPPYDHALASGLAREGHAVTVLTSRFPHGRAPEPDGYAREELFAPVSTRLFRRSRLRLAAKGLEYGPSVTRLVRRIERLDPDVVHVQWLPRPELDRRWLRRLAAERPVVLTAHDVLPRRRQALAVWPEVLETAERVVVHSGRAAAVVLPYRRLDSSGVLATAIGYRRPVVVTDVGSLGEIVREFGAGEVVPPDDPHALAEATTRLLEPKALAAARKGAERAAA